jgi:DNA polymerase-3 subunit delta
LARAPSGRRAPPAAAPRSALPALDFLGRARLPEACLYVLTGPDDYLREQVLARLRQDLLDPGLAEFNHVRLEGGPSTRASSLLDEMAGLPMLAERRLVELHNAPGLRPEVQEALARWILAEGSGPQTVLAVLWPQELAGPLGEALAARGLAVDCRLDEAGRRQWLERALGRLGVDSEPGVPEALARRAGNDLRHLASQLDKLAAYAGPGGKVTVAAVEELVSRSAEVKTWELTAAIGKRNLRGALQVLHTLLAEGEAPGALLSYLNSYLRGLAQVAALPGGAAEIARAIPGKREFQVRMTLEELRTWSPSELRGAFELLCRADGRIKSGSDPRLVLELLLLQLCSRKGRR